MIAPEDLPRTIVASPRARSAPVLKPAIKQKPIKQKRIKPTKHRTIHDNKTVFLGLEEHKTKVEEKLGVAEESKHDAVLTYRTFVADFDRLERHVKVVKMTIDARARSKQEYRLLAKKIRQLEDQLKDMDKEAKRLSSVATEAIDRYNFLVHAKLNPASNVDE